MKKLRITGISLAALLVLLAALGGWMLHTESGTRSLLAMSRGWLPPGLTIGDVRGTVGGTLHVTHFRYRDPAIGMDLTVESAALDVAPFALFARRLHVERAEIKGVWLELFPATEPKPASKRDPWEAPLFMRFDELSLERGELRRPEAAPFIITRAALAGSWSGTNIEASKLTLESPDGAVNLSARIGSRAPKLQQLVGDFRWRAGEHQWAGTLKAAGARESPRDRRCARSAGQGPRQQHPCAGAHRIGQRRVASTPVGGTFRSTSAGRHRGLRQRGARTGCRR